MKIIFKVVEYLEDTQQIVVKFCRKNAPKSIDEYGGDYIWIPYNSIINIADLTSEEKLSIVANFGDWFYEKHIKPCHVPSYKNRYWESKYLYTKNPKIPSISHIPLRTRHQTHDKRWRDAMDHLSNICFSLYYYIID